MKLCLIADGRSIHTQRWASYFAARHEVHLITYDPPGVPLPGVRQHLAGSKVRNQYLAFWPRHLAIARFVREIDPDLIHAHFIAKYGFHLPLLGRSPAVLSAWGDDVLILPRKSRLIRWFTAQALRSADLIYAVSQDIKRHIEEDFSIPPDRVRHLPFGVDTEIFAPHDRPSARTDDRIEVFSNRDFYPVYDHGTLLAGFAKAVSRNRRLHLTLKGDGPEKQRIESLVSSLDLADAVTVLPKTDHADVPVDLAHADLFVTTSVSDGTPVSLLEAMACGLPVVATAVGGIPEWIEDGRTGLLIPPENPDILAEKILMLAEDADCRAALGARAREAVVRRGSWQQLMAGVEEDYLRLVGRRGGER